MRPHVLFVGILVASLYTAVLTGALSPQVPAQTPPSPAGAQGQGRAGGGGGGRGGPGLALFTEHCASCHGTDLSGGRAASLFDEQWLATTTDEKMLDALKHGKPGTEMESFAELLDEQQMWQLVLYVRTQAGALKPRAPFVADPHGVVLTTAHQKLRAEVLARDLETPWALAFLPDGRLLVTERPGRLRILDRGTLSEPVKGIPAVHAQQDGGLLDVEVHPRYAQDGWIYLAYSEVKPGFVPQPPGAAPATPAPAGRGRGPSVPSMTVVVRGKLSKANEWVEQQEIFRAPADLYTPSGSHFGLRMIFDRQGHLFYTLGERGVMQDAQDLSKPTGKIHRVTDTGGVPKDNPFVSRSGALPTIWSYGHRNPEGLAWDPVTGKLWSSEHGPTGGDEVNVIEPGKNYGWGVATKGSQPGITKTSAPGMIDPVVYYTPTIGPAGMTFYTGTRYAPAWRNSSVFLSALAGQQLRRLEIKGTSVTRQEVLFDQFGRVRDIVQGPDGYFYLALQNPTGAGTGLGLSASTPGRVIRLVPLP